MIPQNDKKKRRLLVTGASGFLGWNICSVAHKSWDVCGVAFSNPLEVSGVDIKVVDLTDYYHHIK
jgi:dTDP-4-dehydrorhamnose reductase